jgi:ABC-type multidrug transport system fused ATPase/permease subunit
LKLPAQKTDDPEKPQQVREPSVREQLSKFWQNKVYVWSCLAIALSNFVMSGAQFLWIRFFMDVWSFDKSFVTLMFLICTGIGGVLGITTGPAYIDKLGGYDTPLGVSRSLNAFKIIVHTEAAFGLIGIMALFGKNQMDDNWGPPLGDHWFWTLMVCMFVFWFCHNFCIPGLTGIYMSVLPDDMRSLGSGVEITVRNIFGQACGPMLPGFVMDLVVSLGVANTTGDQFTRRKSQLTWAFGIIVIANVLQVFLIKKASDAADRAVFAERMQVQKKLQTAIANVDLEALESGMKSARRVNLGSDPNFEPLLGVAGEILGELKGGLKRARASTACWFISQEVQDHTARDRLVTAEPSAWSGTDAREEKMEMLEKENSRLKTEIEDLKKEIESITDDRNELRRRLQRPVVAL